MLTDLSLLAYNLNTPACRGVMQWVIPATALAIIMIGLPSFVIIVSQIRCAACGSAG